MSLNLILLFIKSNGELEIWCTALKRPEATNNDDPQQEEKQKSTKRRKLNSSQSKTTASEPSDPTDNSSDIGTRRMTRSLSRAQNKIKTEGKCMNIIISNKKPRKNVNLSADLKKS